MWAQRIHINTWRPLQRRRQHKSQDIRYGKFIISAIEHGTRNNQGLWNNTFGPYSYWYGWMPLRENNLTKSIIHNIFYQWITKIKQKSIFFLCWPNTSLKISWFDAVKSRFMSHPCPFFTIRLTLVRFFPGEIGAHRNIIAILLHTFLQHFWNKNK
jgi:hypothetical protein